MGNGICSLLHREMGQPTCRGCTPAGGARARRHTITLIDENVEPIDFDRCARADIVGVTGTAGHRVVSSADLPDRAGFPAL